MDDGMGMLSQEEINALLSGMDTDASDSDASMGEILTDAEKDAVGEVSNISMGTAATTLFSLVNQKVNITTPVVTYATWDDLIEDYARPCVFIQISYKEGLDGSNILVIKEKDVKIITDLMMGGDGSNIDGELSELHLSAISEAMNQMMGSAATSISSMLEKKVDISPPLARLVDFTDYIDAGMISEFLKGKFVKVSFRMEIGNLVDSELMQLYPFDFARSLYNQFVRYTGVDSKTVESEVKNINSKAGAPAASYPAPQQQAAPPVQQQMPPQMPPQDMVQGQYQYQMPPQDMMHGQYQYQMPPQGQMPSPYMMPNIQDVNIAPAQFQQFVVNSSPLLQTENIDLLLDVPLEVTVELGRTTKSIKEILDFTPGTIIELNRLAGEPIDVLVNGKFVAKGEVVVIEDAFGIRVTDIIK